MNKLTKKYYFSVEGWTEKWYLDWLKNKINADDGVQYKLATKSEVMKPVSFVKRFVTAAARTEIWHLADYEGYDRRMQFRGIIDDIRKAEKCGSQVTYHFGYTNMAFDLWMILHKQDFFVCSNSVKDYLRPLQKCYGYFFQSMSEYKEEDNFKRCLDQLDLNDVIKAIHRAEMLVANNQRNYQMQSYKKCNFFEENPATDIHIPIKRMLHECGLIK